MTITAAMVKELRELTGAGVMACKKALVETDGDQEAAIEILRKKGEATAVKKSGRIAAEGVVFTAVKDGKAAIVEVNSETDFVAKNEKFQTFVSNVANQILDSDAADIDAFMAEPWALDTTKTVKDELVSQIAVIGENMNIRRFKKIESDGVLASYIHAGGKIGVLVDADAPANDTVVAAIKTVAMQIAAMNPLAIDEDGVSEDVKQKEIEVAIEKTKAEQVQKAVEAALKKANINPAHVDSEDHMESNMAKGWITAEDVAKAKEIIATVSAEKAAHLPEQMIQNIAKGRLAKFLKEVCLLNQENIMDSKKTVREVLAAADPELKIVDFKRFTLKAE